MSTVAGRPRHPVPDLEAILVQAEAHGWTVTKGKKYFKLKCGCGKHLSSCHLTPRRNYGRNRLAEWKRTCWKKEGEGCSSG